MRTRILPYRAGSASARALSAALDIPVLRRENSRFRPQSGDLILNWGAHSAPAPMLRGAVRWLNYPLVTMLARDKLACFIVLSEAGVPTVEWTDSTNSAQAWLDAGDSVFIRRTTTGQGGAGIDYITSPGFVAPAPLYTKRYNAAHEYRIHVVHGHTFVTKKRRRDGVAPSPVRNHANGYVYCTNNVDPVPLACEVAVAAVRALQLDFGAVDLMTKNGGVEPRVLEVNTAPGIEGRTVDWYAARLGELLQEVA